MREMKCRAWDETHKDWVDYGFCLRFDADGTCEILNAFVQPFTDRVLILSWWTGLRDHLGKEIYEGDIVVVWNMPESVKSIVCIGASEIEVPIYDDSISRPYYGVYLEGSINLEQFLLRGEMEVIGNIYENPELIGASPC